MSAVRLVAVEQVCSGMLSGGQAPRAKEFDEVLELKTKRKLVTLSEAVTSITNDAGAAKAWPFVGLRMVKVAGAGACTTILIELVALAPKMSVATAEKVYVFGASPLTAWLYGALVSVPINVPS